MIAEDRRERESRTSGAPAGLRALDPLRRVVRRIPALPRLRRRGDGPRTGPPQTGPPQTGPAQTGPAQAGRPQTGRARAGRARTRRRLRTRTRVLIAAGLVALVAVLGGGWLWLRDSSLVAIQRVQVTGLDRTDAHQIRTALVTAARGMTTLDVRMATLRAAVSPYPVVKDLRVTTQFPHGMRIDVVEQVPVAVVMLGSQPVPVAPDGTILHDMTASGSLPLLSVRAAPGGSRITEGSALLQLQVLAAAPTAFLPKVSGVSSSYWHGLVVQLRQGPALYFGDDQQLAAKWQAVTAVLNTRQSNGASYVDVTDPQRPAAGAGGAATAAAIAAGAASATTTPATTTTTQVTGG